MSTILEQLAALSARVEVIAAAVGLEPAASAAPAAHTNAAPVENADGSITLPDGTKQWPYAPSGGVVNTIPNTTPPVPPAFGVGATFQRRGVHSDTPMTVTRVGDGVVFAMLGDDEAAFVPSQLDLVTAAPLPSSENH